jgi:dTDP-4-dehydrorhamnose reductase
VKTVVILGGSGMLGSALVGCLARDPEITLHASVRTPELAAACRARSGTVRWFVGDAASALEAMPSRIDWIVNAIGVIKPYIRDGEAATVERAIEVNALLPHRLRARAQTLDARVVQIATDCVFSGVKGRSTEKDAHDALDVYGKTKSLGEVRAPGFHNLRCSIIGPEGRNKRSLLEWFLGQPRKASVNGFTNHLWNGVTTLHFAKIVHGVIEREVELPELQHVLPADTISKADLLRVFAEHYGRGDLTIVPGPAKEAVDRTLATLAPEVNAKLWHAAGYERAPTLRDMVQELARWSYPFGSLEP